MAKRIKGLATVTNALKKKGAAIEQGVKDQLLIAASNIEADANQNKPKTTQTPINIFKYPTDSGLTQIVEASSQSSVNLAAYFEFGTGSGYKAIEGSLEPDARELARQFYVNGQGRLPARPYLLPAYYKHRKIFLSNLRKLVKKIV